MTLVTRRNSPIRDLARLSGRMDRFFDVPLMRAFEDADEGVTSSWVPVVDVVESDTGVRLRAELPGLANDDVDITVENNQLVLQGEKKFGHEAEEGHYRRVESRYGSFFRRFSLPATVDQENIDAEFKSGVLEIFLPKLEEAKPKKISVRVS